MITRALTALFIMVAGLVGGTLPAASQANLYPSTLPPNTVIGRTGIIAGPPQAIPFSILIQDLVGIPNSWPEPQTFNGGINATGAGVCIGCTTNAGAGNLAFGPTVYNYAGGGYPPDTIGMNTGSFWTIVSPYFFVPQAARIGVVDAYGFGAISVASRDSDWTAAGAISDVSITSSVLSVHDRTTSGPSGKWGSYWQCQNTSGAYTTSFQHFCLEASAYQQGASISGDPWNVNPAGALYVLRLDSGLGNANSLPDGNAVTAAVQIICNSLSCNGTDSTFAAGISFGANSIKADGGGNFPAIQFPFNYGLIWYSSAGVQSGVIGMDASHTVQISASAGINMNGPFVSSAGTSHVPVLGVGQNSCAQALCVTGQVIVEGVLQNSGIPTSAGSGGLNVCVDNAGVFYKKSSCP